MHFGLFFFFTRGKNNIIITNNAFCVSITRKCSPGSEIQNYREKNWSWSWRWVFLSMMLTPYPAQHCFDWPVLFANNVLIGYNEFVVSQSGEKLCDALTFTILRKKKKGFRGQVTVFFRVNRLCRFRFTECDAAISVSYLFYCADTWMTNIF